MERTITIDGKEYNAVYKARTAKIFTEHFKKDLLIEKEKLNSKFLKRINSLTEDEEDLTIIYILLEVGGREFLEQATYACIRTDYEMQKKKFPTFDKWLDEIDDYDNFIVASYGIYELIVFGNRTIVEPEKVNEETKEESKDKKK